MKWIGQHIWDFISRFRSDVYLEGTETGTIASGGNLGLDANNKIVKAASGSGDLTITNATDDRVVTSTGGTGLNAEANLTWDGEDLIAYSSTSSKPALKLQNSNTNDQGSLLQFSKSQNGEADDELGQIQFIGRNVDGSSFGAWAEIIAYIQDPAAGAEEGKLVINVASHDQEQQPGLQIYSGDVEDEVDVTIGNGVDSTTAVAGNLTARGGNLEYGNDTLSLTSSISSLPAINLVNSNTDANPSVLTFQKIANGANNDGIGRIDFKGDDDGGDVHTFASISSFISNATNTDEAGSIYIQAAMSNGTSTTQRQVLSGIGHGTDSKIDVGIAYGTDSITTIAGDLDIDGDEITSAGALKITPADVSGIAFHIDADADTDNEVQIDAGLLDINTTGSITIDAADDISITATDNLTLRAEDDVALGTTSADGLLSLTSVHTAGQAIHIVGNTNSGSIVDIDAGILDIDVTAGTSITSGEEISLISGDSKYYKTYDFNGTTFENQYNSGQYSGKILKYSPGADDTLTAGQIWYLRSNGRWVNANADDDGGGGPGYGDSQLLGVGLGGSSRTVGALIEGFIRIPYTEILNNPGSGNVDGLPLYVSTTGGHFDFTAPSDSGDYVRVVGYAVDDHTDSGNTDVLVYFNPSKTWIEIA
jgi:hypothetical protein